MAYTNKTNHIKSHHITSHHIKVQLHQGPLHGSVETRKPIWHFEKAFGRSAETEEIRAVQNADLKPNIPESVKSVSHPGTIGPGEIADKLPPPGFGEGISALAVEGKVSEFRPLGSSHSSVVR